jgi:uncharacterized phiE125 gp8 family phage protein
MNRTAYKVTTAPASEPISTADAKTYLNVTTSLHDTLIDNIVKTARLLYERYTDSAVISQTITEVWEWTPGCGEFELSVSPVSSVTSLSYIDDDGDYQVWASSNYTTDAISPLYRIVKKSTAGWPTVGDFPSQWKAIYVAGYANAAAVPEDIISAILLMVGFLYENREDIPINDVNNPRIRSFASLAFGHRYHLI